MEITTDPFELKWDKADSLYRDAAGDPFCPTCYDKDMKRMHLLKDGTSLRCNVCNFRKIMSA
jgi:hypothetical protein